MKIFKKLKTIFHLKKTQQSKICLSEECEDLRKHFNMKWIFFLLFLSACLMVTDTLHEHFYHDKSVVNDINNLYDVESFNSCILFADPVSKSTTVVDNDYFEDVVFVGDSVTSGIKLYKTAKNALVLSKTGLNIEVIDEPIEVDGQVMSIIDFIKQSARKKIYIMIGSNGIGWLKNDYMIRLYGEWINKVKQQVPGCVIFVQSVLPITKELSDFNLTKQNMLTNEKISSYNAALQEMCRQKQVYFLDVAQEFKNEEGALPDEASPVDGMHINAEYYNLWLEYIKWHTVADV